MGLLDRDEHTDKVFNDIGKYGEKAGRDLIRGIKGSKPKRTRRSFRFGNEFNEKIL